MTGFVAYDPVNTPVLSRFSSWRSTSFFVAAWRRYSTTASACSPVVRSATSGCSGARTMNVAPNSVSGRVVNTVIGPAGDGKWTSAPVERPIQLRWIVFSESVQSRWSRSSIRRSA